MAKSGKAGKREKNLDAVQELPEARAIRDRVRKLSELEPQEFSAELAGLLKSFSPTESPDVAVALAEELGKMHTEAVIPALRMLDQPDQPKVVVKAARRALRRLSLLGVYTDEPSVPKKAEVSLIGGGRILSGSLSEVDGKGSQYLSLLITSPLVGTQVIEMIASDIEGFREVVHAPITRREYDAHIAEVAESGQFLVHAPPEYVAFRAVEYEAVHENTGKSLPSRYLDFCNILRSSAGRYERPIIYDEIGAEAAEFDASLAARVEELYDLDIFKGWVIEESRLRPYVEEYIKAEESPLVIPEHLKEDRIRRVLDRAAEELFDEQWRARYKRRLEENAYVLLKIGKLEHARIALSCALQLGALDVPSSSIQFVRFIINFSIGVYAGLTSNERRIYRA